MIKMFSNKILINSGLFLIGLYSLVSILIGAYYSYPNAEDLSVVVLARDKGIIQGAVVLLQTFDGRYTTNLLHGLNPLAFDLYYENKIMPVITFGLFTLAVFTLLNSRFREIRKSQNGLYAFVFTSLFFSVLDLSQSLYWMICSFVYIYPIIFFLFFYSFFLKYKQSSKLRHYFISLLFLFLSVGCCELYIPIFGIILLILFFYFRYDRKFKRITVWYLLVYTFSVLLFITSPGIANRLTSYDGLRDELSFGAWLYKAFEYSLLSFDAWSYLPLFLFLLLFFMKYHISNHAPYKILIVLIGLLTIIGTWGIVIYLMGDTGFSSRIIPVVVFVALLTLSFALPHYANKLNSRINYVAISLVMLFFCFENSYLLIYKDFQQGKLTTFKKEMDLQYNLLKERRQDNDSSCISNVTLRNIDSFLPHSIATHPYIKPNREEGFWNRAYETYFKIDEVRLEGDSLQIINLVYETRK